MRVYAQANNFIVCRLVTIAQMFRIFCPNPIRLVSWGIGQHFLMIHLAILYEIGNIVIQLIGIVDIPFIQSPMLVDGPDRRSLSFHAH